MGTTSAREVRRVNEIGFFAPRANEKIASNCCNSRALFSALRAKPCRAGRGEARRGERDRREPSFNASVPTRARRLRRYRRITADNDDSRERN